MTSNYYQKKGITLGQVAQFCKELGWKPSCPEKFLFAAHLLVCAKVNTYTTDTKKPVRRFGFLLNKINLN